VPYFPSEVGIRIPCFPIASRKWELEHPIFPQKWEPGYPVIDGSGNQSTLFLREVGVRVPCLTGRRGKWESEYPIFPREVGVRVPCLTGRKLMFKEISYCIGEKTLTFIMALATPAAYLGS
jgi:hypothetical protein